MLHLVTRSHRRGAEVFASELAVASDALGSRNTVYAVAQAADGQQVDSLPPLVASRRLGLVTYLCSAWRIRKVLAREPADVVLAHGGWAALVVALAVPRTSARVWQRILGLPLDRWGPLRRGAWRAIARRFDGVVALTPGMEAEMRELGYEGPVWPIGNARDPERFRGGDRLSASRSLREEIGLAPEVPLLGFVGHFVPQKDPELAVDVLAEVRRQGSPAHLVMAGAGPRHAAVVQRIEEHGLKDQVTLLGHRDDPEAVFRGADLVLITSRAEGIPGVAIEAQMTGCPVVTFLLGAVEDVVEDGVTGAIVPWREPLLMADQVAALLSDPCRLHEMSIGAEARAAEFTTASTAAIYMKRFTELRRARLDAFVAVAVEPA